MKSVISMKSVSSRPWLFALIAVVSLVAAACGDGNDSATTPTTGQGTSDASSSATRISGSVNISGSSTVEPISVRVAELFENVESGVNVTVDGPGTGDGFRLFCTGETDISGASRQIKDAEAETCAENNINWIELRVGIDGIAVMTNNDNPLDCVSFADLYALVGPESQGINNWSDGQDLANELGSSTNLPDMSLDVFGPGEESGTFDSFIELVLEDIADERSQDVTTRVDYSANANDNVIIQGITSNSGSLGWVGFAYAVNADNVKLLEVDGGGVDGGEADGGDGCVPANPGTIASGEYPISRSLYIYVNADNAADNSALQAYVDYYMSEGLDVAVPDVGYVPLTDDSKAQTLNNWNDRRIG